MTTKDAVLALAAKVGGVAQSNVATTSQALTALAKAATGKTPEAELKTTDDCVYFIAANYSGGGGIEPNTIIDDDLTFTYGEDRYGYPQAVYSTTDSAVTGLFALQYGSVAVCDVASTNNIASEYPISDGGINGGDVSITIGGSTYAMGWYVQENESSQIELRVFIGYYDQTGPDATLQTWCQTAHHVTITEYELFAED